MSHRMNFMIDEDNWQHLSHVPRGERSRWVNAALANYRQERRRSEAAREMDVFAESLSSVEGTSVDWVRAERRRDG